MSGISPINNNGYTYNYSPKDALTNQGNEKTDSTRECQTCENRRYQDGSNEMVSFKSPTRISPQAALLTCSCS